MGCNKERNSNYSTYRHGSYQYMVKDEGGEGSDTILWTTYQQYMCDEGFPDSIIVKVTRDGKFLGYDVAYRRETITDSLGNFVSPAYVIMFNVGDGLVYNLKGELVRTNESSLPHSGQGDPDHVWKP